MAGIPSDFTGNGSGASGGPEGIRKGSDYIYGFWVRDAFGAGVVDVHTGERMILNTDNRKRVDIGDLLVAWPDVRRFTSDVAGLTYAITSRGAFPVILGGDHYIAFPSFLGYQKAKFEAGESHIGYVQVDAHADILERGSSQGPLWHASNARRVAELPGMRTEDMVFVGISDWMAYQEWSYIHDNGCTLITDTQLRDAGAEATMRDAIEIAGRDADSVYVSLDIDAVHVAEAPGTVTGGTFGGLSALEFVEVAGCISDSDKVGSIDLVEVAPNRDPRGTTTHLAAVALLHALRDRVFDRE